MDDFTKKLIAIEKGIKEIKENMSTKEEMKSFEERIEGKIGALESKLLEKIDEAQMEIIETVDKHKADNIKVDSLEKRIERLEDKASLPPLVD